VRWAFEGTGSGDITAPELAPSEGDAAALNHSSSHDAPRGTDVSIIMSTTTSTTLYIPCLDRRFETEDAVSNHNQMSQILLPSNADLVRHLRPAHIAAVSHSHSCPPRGGVKTRKPTYCPNK
jgi:hypothetical protein